MNVLQTMATYCPDRNKIKIVELRTLQDVLLEIRNGKVTGTIQQLRHIPNDEAHKPQSRKKKEELPLVLWQGIFNKRRKEGLEYLNGIICLDIDHLPLAKLIEIKNGLVISPFVVAFFASPSGDGLKILFQTDLHDPAQYTNCYMHLEKLFVDAYGVKPDENCKDIARGCYLSWDPYLYVNPDAKVYHYEFDPTVEKVNSQSSGNHSSIWVPPVITPEQSFLNKMSQQVSPMSDEKIIEILDRRFQGYPENYKDGHRTKSIFSQAAKLCKAGIPEDKTSDYLASQFLPTGYDARKLKNELHRAYEVSKDYFGCERGQYKPYSEYKKNHQ